LMEALEFEFVIQHPYPILVQYLRKMFVTKEEQKLLEGQKGLAQCAWFFVNDSLRSTLCLTHEPEHVALGALNLALKHKKIDYDKLKKRSTPWFMEFEVSKEELDAVGAAIIKAYADSSRVSQGSKHKYTPEELERRRKLESLMTPSERQKYVKMTSEERAAFRRKLAERRQATKRNPQSCIRNISTKNDPNASSSSNAMTATGKTIAMEAENQVSMKKLKTGSAQSVHKQKKMLLEKNEQAQKIPQEPVLESNMNGGRVELKDSTSNSVVSSAPAQDQLTKERRNGTKRSYESEEKSDQNAPIHKKLKVEPNEGQIGGNSQTETALTSEQHNGTTTDHG